MIRILDPQVADQIAAGEVVERPVSIVKELVENAIDAGARTIVCEIKKGGKELIRLTDDGCGIAAKEVQTAFLRHATSKIACAEDLARLSTLGFRGEALASIAAVARVEMMTRTADETVGTRILLEGGKVLESGGIGCPEGTTILVRDLFFNTPARAKFLKSDSGEAAQITALMKQMALAYPGIRIRLIGNGQTVMATRGSGKHLDAIAATQGPDHIAHLISLHQKKKGLSLTGYVASPQVSHASRRYQVYFVNGRNVDSKVMERGVDLAYRDRLFAGRYPEVYLFLSVDPAVLDANIHPNKRQVRFDDEVAVTAFVRNAVTEALASKRAVPDGLIDQDMKKNPPAKENPSSQTHISYADEKEKKVEKALDGYRQEQASRLAEEQMVYEISKEKRTRQATLDVARLSPLGSIFETYILAADQQDLYLIDQHAAHERINFERILRQIQAQRADTQMVAVPSTVDGVFADEEWQGPLIAIGYQLEEFGPSTWRIQGIPSWMNEEMATVFLREYMEMAERGEEDWAPARDAAAKMADQSTVWMERAAEKACKASVKGGDKLHPEEIQRLLSDLAACSNPFSCPHGRPTLIKLSRSDIEKRFKRI